MIVAGLDLSINSSGITIRTENDEYKYIIVTSKMTKNLKSNTNKKLKIIEYNKSDDKDNNIHQIATLILGELKHYKVKQVVIEDVALGAIHSRSLIDLTGLNYYVRCLLKENNIDYITVPPTLWKKVMLANGQATKDIITDAFKRITKFESEVKKIDDVADSYFLCNFYIQN